MLRGFKDKYLKSVSGKANENQVCEVIRERFNPAWQETLRWQSFWQTTLRLFYPDLDNVTFGTSAGEVKFNRVYTSDPANFLTDRIEFISNKIFPRDGMWYKAQPFSMDGQFVQKSALSLAEQRYMDEMGFLSRELVKASGFYDTVDTSLLHYSILGEAYPFVTLSMNEMEVSDLPVHRIGVLKTSAGKQVGIGYYQTMDDWEIVAEYGRDALALFEKNMQGTMPRPGGHNPYGQLHGIGTGGLGHGISGAITPAAGVYTTGTGGTTVGGSGKGQRVKSILKVTLPNKAFMGIPFGGLESKMEYVTFSIAETTNRLLDVEFHPTKPFGPASDKRISGEYFARGLGSRLLPDVGVLNNKKKYELYASALTSGSPIVVEGQGFTRPIGNRIFPFQVIHAKEGTKVSNLYDRANVRRSARSAFEDEILSLRQGMGLDKMQMEPKSHVSGGTYTQYQDANFSMFAPSALRLQEKIGITIVNAIIQGGILMGKLPPPPPEMVESPYTYKLVPYSVFSFGQESQKGQNLMRAFHPVAEFMPHYPQLLDRFNIKEFWESNMSSYELSHYINNDEQAQRAAEERMAMSGKAGGREQLPPEDEAVRKRTQQATENQLTDADVMEYAGV